MDGDTAAQCALDHAQRRRHRPLRRILIAAGLVIVVLILIAVAIYAGAIHHPRADDAVTPLVQFCEAMVPVQYPAMVTGVKRCSEAGNRRFACDFAAAWWAGPACAACAADGGFSYQQATARR